MPEIQERTLRRGGITRKHKQFSREERDRIPVTPIGATNPYALALANAWQSGDCFEWENITDETTRMVLLEKYAAKYEILFDPMLSPVLYQGVEPVTVAMIGHPGQRHGRPDMAIVHNPIRDKILDQYLVNQAADLIPKEDAGASGTLEHSIDPSGFADLKKVRANISSDIRLSNFVSPSKHWMLYDTQIGSQSSSCSATPSIWSALSGVKYYNRGIGDIHKEIVDDFMQGAVPDCFLIAAMAAWMWWIKWPSGFSKTDSSTGPYPVTLYDANGSAVYSSINNELPLPTSTATRPAYAAITPSNEIYPAIWEKAYAQYKNCGNSSIASKGNLTNPDISRLTGGDPLDALRTISGRKFSWDGTGLPSTQSPKPTAYYTMTPVMDPPLLDKVGLDNSLNLDYFLTQFDSYGKVKNPMVAWTYYTAGSNNPAPGRVSAPSDVRYVADWMVANHAYSVLGKWPKYRLPESRPPDLSVEKENTYIILRNPYGPTYGGVPNMANYGNDPDGTGVLQPTTMWQMSSATYTLNIGQVKPTTDTKVKPDGIFALKLKWFLKYFEGVGWVV